MANTNINIRMDIDLKRQFEAFCADMGMSMSTAFTIFARKAVREYRIPFEIDGIAPNPETIKAIEEVQRERQKFCVHGIIGARQTGASNEHEHQTQFS